MPETATDMTNEDEHLDGRLLYSGNFEEAEKQHQALITAHRFVPERGNRIKKVNIWHIQIVDWFLTHPRGSQIECAEHFGRTQTWLSAVMNSDAFIEFRDQRVRAHQERVSKAIVDQTQKLAQIGLEDLTERLNGEAFVPIGQVKDVTELALKSLGMGGRVGVAPGVGETTVQINNFNGVSSDVLANARAKMAVVVARNTELTENTSPDNAVDAEFVVEDMSIDDGEEEFIAEVTQNLMEFADAEVIEGESTIATAT
jgi:hypothetical protein